MAETRADMPTVDTVAAEVTAQAGTEEATVAQVAATVEEASVAAVEAGEDGATSGSGGRVIAYRQAGAVPVRQISCSEVRSPGKEESCI